MERLDAAVEHFGKFRVGAQVADHEALLAQGLGRAAGGDDLDAGGGQGLGEGQASPFCQIRKSERVESSPYTRG